MVLSLSQWLALAPMLVLAAGITGLLLLISAVRNHAAVAQLTTLGFLLAAAATQLSAGSVAVTPLLVVDDWARAVQVLVLLAGAATTLLAYGYLERIREPREEWYVLLLIASLGALVLAGARHAASLVLGIELLAVSLFGMIAQQREQRHALEAGFKYLVLSGASSATLLLGLALAYAATGSLQLDRMLAATPLGPDRMVAAIGAALVFAGVGFKLSLVPFHQWTPDVYQGAPAPVTGFLATVSKGALVAALARWFAASPPPVALAELLTLVAVASMLLGNLLALLADNFKRLLAYSSIAHFGYLMVPLLAGGATGAEALLYYLVAYFVMTLACFGGIALLSAAHADGETEHLHDLRGLFWRRPYVTSVLTPMLLALAGVPLTAGFLAKFYALAAGVKVRAWLLVAALVLGSAIGLYYYLRAVIVMFLPHPVTEFDRVTIGERTVTAGAALAVLLVALFWFGVLPADLLDGIATAAASLR